MSGVASAAQFRTDGSFYVQDPRVTARSEQEIAEFRASKQMTVSF